MSASNQGIAVVLSDSTRELFRLMNFEDIPAEAKYIGFTEDGTAFFIQDMTREGIAFPRMTMISYYENVQFVPEQEGNHATNTSHP